MHVMNKHTIVLCFILVIQCVVFDVNAGGIINNATIVLIDPQRIQATPTQTNTVDIFITNITNIGAFQFDIVFDPNVLTITSASAGNFISSTNREIMAAEAVITNGKLTFAVVTKGVQDGPSGSGKLASILFTINDLPDNDLKYTTTTLDLDNVLISDIQGYSLTVDSIRDTDVIITLNDQSSPIHIKMNGGLRMGHINNNRRNSYESQNNFINNMLYNFYQFNCICRFSENSPKKNITNRQWQPM